MKKVLLALFLGAVPALADGDGVEVLPFSSAGGSVSGVVIVSPDGSARVQGQIQGVPFGSAPWSKVWRGDDDSYHFDDLLIDGDLMIKKKPLIPLQLKFNGTEEDSKDGDDTDDDVGEITVQSQTGVGKGAIELKG